MAFFHKEGKSIPQTKGVRSLLFGRHINHYYLRYLPAFLVGILALITVDYTQLVIPEFYRSVINGMVYGTAQVNGETVPFDMPYLLDHVCLPMIFVIVLIVVGRFGWRVCFRGAAIRMETHLRGRMFDHCKDLSQQYYQVNKVGNLTVILPHFSAAWADFNVYHNLWEMLHTCSKFRKLFA